MEVVAHPSLIPTSQVQGDAAGNAEAMAPRPHAEIPVSSPRPQPQVGYPAGSITWESLGGAK